MIAASKLGSRADYVPVHMTLIYKAEILITKADMPIGAGGVGPIDGEAKYEDEYRVALLAPVFRTLVCRRVIRRNDCRSLGQRYND